jgi:hypothetical protein
VAAPGDDTCQADLDFWAYGWTNPEGDTCHHWKGDTWHGMTSAADMSRMTWQYGE